MLKNLFLSLILVASFGTLAQAQVRTPAPSPTATFSQPVGMTNVEVTYSRPSMKGRTIFAKDGLVPFGKLWRTGANLATKITFEHDVKVADKDLSAGSYAILTKPGKNSWDIHFYSYEKGGWSSYLDKTPAAKVTAKPMKVTDAVESFTIALENLQMESAQLSMTWANTKVMVPITVEVKERVMKNIEQVMAGPSRFDHFRAATFMHDAGMDLNKALEHIEKATEKESAFFMEYRKALILSDLGRKKDALAAAKTSLAQAKEAGNDDYVRLNEKLIAQWSK